jgi:hypothetical protein
MACVNEIRWMDPRTSVRTAIWSLLPLASGCPADDPLAEALVDGCWQRSFSEDIYDDVHEPDWEPFTCSLPTICDPIAVDAGFGGPTPEQIAATDGPARCMLEAMRDGIPAAHVITWSPDGGVFWDRMIYHVLPDGVVGFDDHGEDLGSGVDEMYRRRRDDAFFDECLAQTEPPLGCLLGQSFPPLDREACIDDVPRCPE